VGVLKVTIVNVQRGIVVLILYATHANHQTIVVRGYKMIV